MPTLNRRRELLLLLLITLLGAFLRLYRLDSLPPGDGYDVAQYGVDALQILNGARPIFLESNFGREALFSYLVALVYRLTGPGSFGIHLTSAIIGILTIPAIYLVARELPVGRRQSTAHCPLPTAYFPLLAALLTAISYWHLNWSRVGLRVILIPFFACLIFYFLWRGLRTTRRVDFAAAGILLGLSLYTYQAARLLPLLVLAAFILWAIAQRRFGRSDLLNLLLAFGLALLIFAPMGLYSLQNPGQLSVRAEQAVLIDRERPLLEQLPTLLGQTKAALLMYNFQGDDEPMFTIAGRPSLNPFLSLFFFLGLALCLWRWRRPGYLFLLGWLAAMTAPAMIASQAATAKRALGAFPAAVLLIAVGMVWVVQVAISRWQVAGNRWQGREAIGTSHSPLVTRHSLIPNLQSLILLFLLAGLLYSAALTWRDYFVVWASDPDLPIHFQVDHAEIGKYIGRLLAEETIFLSPYPAEQPVIQLHSGLHPNVRSYNGRHCLIYPNPAATTTTTYLIVPGFEDHSLEQLQLDFPEGELTTGPLRPNSDRPYYHAFRVEAGAQPAKAPGQTAAANWDNLIELFSYDLQPAAPQPGDMLTLTLYYRALAETPIHYTAFVHLLGDPNQSNPQSGSPLWSQSDSEPCQGGLPTGRWREGEIIRDTLTLTLPPDIPPGDYQLVTGFYTWPDLTRLPVINGERPAAEQSIFLQTIRLQ